MMSIKPNLIGRCLFLIGVIYATASVGQALDPDLLERLSDIAEQRGLSSELQTRLTEAEGSADAERSERAPVARGNATSVSSKTRSTRPQVFGYEVFRQPVAKSQTANISVPSDYLLGPGDSLQVQLFGKINRTLKLPVGRDGQISFPELGPITVTGMRFEDAIATIERRVAQEMIGNQVSVTFGALRAVPVFVLGDVAAPGSYTVSALSTVTHALIASGGFSPVGSLRRVQLKRNGRLVREIDFYDLLLKGDSSGDIRLQPGDVIFVPPVGRQVTVEGEVKRPAIYEMRTTLTVAGAFDLAGGLRASSEAGTAQIERIETQGKRVLLSLDLRSEDSTKLLVQDGDRIIVRKVAMRAERSVSLEGPVKYPGDYPLELNPDVHTLLDRAQLDFGQADADPYTSYALVERRSTSGGRRSYLAFSVQRAIEVPDAALALQEGDRVLVFSRKDIAFLNSSFVRSALSGDEASLTRCKSLAALAPLTNSPRGQRLLSAVLGDQSFVSQKVDERKSVVSKRITQDESRLDSGDRERLAADDVDLELNPHVLKNDVVAEAWRRDTKEAQEEKKKTSVCPDIFENNPHVITQLLDQSIGVFGEVQQSGIFPIASEIPLSEVLDIVGGLTREADPARIEYVSYQASAASGTTQYQTLSAADKAAPAHRFSAGDSLQVRPRYVGRELGSVQLNGEFKLPGRYTILRGETLNQLIARAGGLTDFAYPYGAVLTRESARRLEQQSLKRTTQELQDALVTTITSGALSGGNGSSAADFLKLLIVQVETSKPVGRIVIEADPAILDVRPELDVRLEPGDEVTIPKRPTSVTVAGQVLSPGSVSFIAGDSASDYIEKAGGDTQYADLDQAFVVYPNGQAKSLNLSFWNFRDESVPPGSYIVIPRDTPPVYSLFLTEKIAGIFSNLAVSAAALSTIANN